MAQIVPFKGTRYNPEVIQDLNQVVCPPYDVISPQQQEELYNKNQHNFVRIEYNRETLQDTPRDNRYTRAADNIDLWMKDRVLETDVEPGLYYHKHYFNCQGKKYIRDNIIALVRLEEWDSRIIRPHENIIPRAKSDRMRMLDACQANTSTVLSMYSDPESIIAMALSRWEKNPPIIDVFDGDGERHVVWAITESDIISQIQKVLSGQPLYIADGHHRYDSSLTYCRERKVKTPAVTGEEGFNFVMMNLFDLNNPGVVILPTHRLLKGVSSNVIGELRSKLETFFDIEELSLDTPDEWEQADRLFSGVNSGSNRVKLAIFGLGANKLSILTLKSLKTLDRYMPAGHSDIYKQLDVSVVDHIVLENLIGFVKDREDMVLEYSHDRVDTIKKVQQKQFQLAFILGPRKSTYFYPKAPAGLVFYKW
jgi:uncharacterized protein (DUF1015 family)